MAKEEEIEKKIINELLSTADIDPMNIAVSAHYNGIVILGGLVTTYIQKIKAEEALMNIKGIKGIVNEIKVEPTQPKSDVEIAKEAIAALSSNPDVPIEKIKVVVEDGVVTLAGEVKRRYQKKVAEEIIWKITGVKGVVNDVKIKPEVPLPPHTKEKIIKEIEQKKLADPENIKIEIEGNKVILKGKVQSLTEMLEVAKVAWSIPGVAEVDNHFIIGVD